MGTDQVAHAQKETAERRAHNPDLAEAAGLATDRLPQNNAEADIAEEILTKALNNLSFNEQEKISFDLHGFDTIPPVCEMSKLEELEKELSLTHKKPAFERAKHLNPSFVEDSSFRLMFLRAERFNAKQAAELMVYHFQIKKELFGDSEILARDVRLRDLRSCDLECLRSGFAQICPSRDAAGRLVILTAPMRKTSNDVLTLNRAMWYMMMSAAKDEETQKKGLNVVFYNYEDHTDDLNMVRQLRRAHAAFPFWVTATHFCYHNAYLRPAIMGLQLFLPDNGRFRFRAHYVDIKDVTCKLQAYGIPVNENYPMECSTGRWSIEQHHEWLKTQEANEAKESLPHAPVEAPIIVPERFDVLFGKAKKARIHTGTVRCVCLVEMNRERYEKARKYEKTTIADRIISIIHESHGRFLKWEEEQNGWVEVEHKVAREKVSHFFRQLRSKINMALAKSADVD